MTMKTKPMSCFPSLSYVFQFCLNKSVSATSSWACPSYASPLVGSFLVPFLPSCCLASSEHGPVILYINRLLLIHVEIGSMLQHLSRSSFLIFSEQKIFLLRLRHFVWNVSRLLQISFVVFHHSDLWSSMIKSYSSVIRFPAF